jgi:hypothetical protein
MHEIVQQWQPCIWEHFHLPLKRHCTHWSHPISSSFLKTITSPHSESLFCMLITFYINFISYAFWNHIICALFWLFFSLSITFSRFIHIVACVRHLFIFGWITVYHMDIPIVCVHPSFDGHSGCIHSFCYCEQCCYEHSRTSFSEDTCFHFTWVHTSEGAAAHMIAEQV